MDKRAGFKVIGEGSEADLDKMRQRESELINNQVRVERDWWEDRIIPDEILAIKEGTLLPVPGYGAHYMTIARIRLGIEPKSLNLLAYGLLSKIQREWAISMKARGIPVKRKYLAVTSLYRSLDMQKSLAATSYLASKGFSAHNSGAAIDFDPNGYYSGAGRLSVQSNKAGYVRMYTEVLLEVLNRLVQLGDCHLIVERGIKIEGNRIVMYDACYHVCVSPNFRPVV